MNNPNTHKNWQYLFSPHSVAVIGASNIPGSWGYGVVARLLDSAKRTVYPVNPNLSEVLGIATYRSVLDIPGPVDLAAIVVPASQVSGVSRECVQKGVRAAVVISSGFAETGEQGRRLEEELVRTVRQGGMSFIGPNSMGYTDTSSHLCTIPWLKDLTPGPVAVVSQSGNYGERIVHTGMASGVGFSKFISSGNEADLHMEDYLEYLAQDENTRVITAYIEGLREGRRFFQLARETTVRKPVVVVKSGGTRGSARAARSHTGALAGSDAVYSAAFKQAGVIRVYNDDELCDVVIALLGRTLPKGNRVAILTIGGGLGVAAAEACERIGLEMAPLSPSTMEHLNGYLPSRWSHGNPVDVAGMGLDKRELLYAALLALLEDENVDAVLFQVPIILNAEYLSSVLGFSDRQIRAFQDVEKEKLNLIGQKVGEYGKPFFVALLMPDPEACSFLQSEGIPVYYNSYRAVRALHHLVWYRHYLDST